MVGSDPQERDSSGDGLKELNRERAHRGGTRKCGPPLFFIPSYAESLPVAGFLYCGSEGDIMEQVTDPYCFLLAGRLAYAPWGARWRKVFGVVPIMRLNSRVK